MNVVYKEICPTLAKNLTDGVVENHVHVLPEIKWNAMLGNNYKLGSNSSL